MRMYVLVFVFVEDDDRTQGMATMEKMDDIIVVKCYILFKEIRVGDCGVVDPRGMPEPMINSLSP